MDDELDDRLGKWGLPAANVSFTVDAQRVLQDFLREEKAGRNRKSKVRKPGTPGERSRPGVDTCTQAHREDAWVDPGLV